jgi:hypothetical protein
MYWRNVFTKMAPGYDPGQIEAYVRLGIQTLSNATNAELRREVKLAKMCIDQAGPQAAAKLAQSYGL